MNLKKILSTSQTKEVDRFTIENEPILSIDLMERASQAFVNAIENQLKKSSEIAVVCGTGNNGGDGFAVARILKRKGYQITPIFLAFSKSISEDCQINMAHLKDIETIDSNSEIPTFEQYDIIVDAIFGSGLTRQASGLPEKVITAINKAKKVVYAIDVPSGLFCNRIPDASCIIKAELTISFQRPYFSFFFKESAEFVGNWKVVDIGLNEEYIQNMDSNYMVLDASIKKQVIPRKKFSHKGSYGHALIIAGAQGKMGAATLAAMACLRSGVGLLTTYIPRCGYEVMQRKVPEAMCLTGINEEVIAGLPELDTYNIIGVGPGIGTDRLTKEMIQQLFLNVKGIGLVIDADALNIISKEKSLLEILPKHSIITPHPKEFERLVGPWSNSEERLKKQQEFSRKKECIVVLKDAHTSITSPEGNVYFNVSGNPGMATGGSGDVLTGIITGLMAQNYSPLKAALIGVYFHGMAGDKVAQQKGQQALVASDLIESLKIE